MNVKHSKAPHYSSVLLACYIALVDISTVEMASSREILLLPLKDSGAPDVPGEYIYLPPPTDPVYVLRLAIEGTSSICRQGSLWVNIPGEGEEFDRSKYHEHRYV